jgi:hypothetical protein
VFDPLEIKETRMVRDQLADSINASTQLQKDGKTVRAAGGHDADDVKPTEDKTGFAKKAVEDGHPEAVAATVAVTVAMANP